MWEYFVGHRPSDVDLESWLDKLGKIGWELVMIDAAGLCIFKRQKRE